MTDCVGRWVLVKYVDDEGNDALLRCTSCGELWDTRLTEDAQEEASAYADLFGF